MAGGWAAGTRKRRAELRARGRSGSRLRSEIAGIRAFGATSRFFERRSNMPSSVIRQFWYDPERHAMDVLFVSGKRYRYHDVPEETYRSMRQSFSKGEFF